jgi:hypothetical protein
MRVMHRRATSALTRLGRIRFAIFLQCFLSSVPRCLAGQRARYNRRRPGYAVAMAAGGTKEESSALQRFPSAN